jgi:predicted ester cyclase
MGLAENKALVRRLFAVEELVAEADRVAARLTLSGSCAGPPTVWGC